METDQQHGDIKVGKLPGDNGGQIGVEAVVSNAGSATATNATVETELPDGTQLAYLGSGGTCSADPCVAGSTLSWDLGTLVPGAERTISYALSVDANADLGERRHVLELDSTEENPQIGEATTNVVAGALTLDKSVTDADGTVNPTYAEIGDVVTYKLTVDNESPSAAPDLVVTDVLPAEVIACGSSCLNLSGSGASLSGNTLTWSNIDLDAREAITLSYSVTIPTVANNTTLENVANVRSTIGQSDSDSARLVITAIAELEGLSPENVFVGNGSDEILAHTFQGLLTSAEELITPDITYSFYPVWANLYGLEHSKVPLSQDFSVDITGLCRTDGAVLLANPNAPTGMTVELQELERLISSKPERLVVIDEAYFGFGAETAVPLVAGHDNLVVTRSLSKSHGLAGLRVGYAIAQAELIEGLNRVKDSFNSYPLDAVAQAAATAAIEDRLWLEAASQSVREVREVMSTGLEALGFEVLPSQANFIFIQHNTLPGKHIFDALRARDILVRRWDKQRIENWLRVSVGTAAQAEQLLAVMREIVAAETG